MNKKFRFFCEYFWIFYIASIFGVIVEMIWCYIRFSKFDSRSALILETINPIYGIMALLLTFLLYKLRNKNIILLFFVAAIGGSLFEAGCSIMQEFIYGTSSWHYGPHLYGILGGHASLLYSVFWGVLGVFWIKVIHPYAISALKKVSDKVIRVLTIVFLSIFIIDVVLSSMAVLRQVERHEGIEASGAVDEFLDKNFDDEFLDEIYANMKIVK